MASSPINNGIREFVLEQTNATSFIHREPLVAIYEKIGETLKPHPTQFGSGTAEGAFAYLRFNYPKCKVHVLRA